MFYVETDADTGIKGLRYKDETVLLPRFEDIKPLPRGLGNYIYRDGGKWGLGCVYCLITEAVYDTIVPHVTTSDRTNGRVYLARKNGKYGIISNAGDQLSKFEFDSISPLVLDDNDHYYPIWAYVAYKEGACSIVNVNGHTIIDNPVIPLQTGNSKQDSKAIINFRAAIKTAADERGVPLKQPDTTSEPSQYDAQFSYIETKDGEYVFNKRDMAKWRVARQADGDFLAMTHDQFYVLKGYSEVCPLRPGDNELPWFKIRDKAGKWGLALLDSVIIKPQYDALRYAETSADLFNLEATKDGLKGIISFDGQELLPIRYEWLLPLSDIQTGKSRSMPYHTFSQIKNGDKYNVVDLCGNLIFKDFKSPGDFDYGKLSKAIGKYAKAHNDDGYKALYGRLSELAIELRDLEALVPSEPGAATVIRSDCEWQRGVLTDFGTITIPMTYNRYDERLKRNPSSSMALYEQIRDIPVTSCNTSYISTENVAEAMQAVADMKEKIQAYKQLQDLMRQKGEGDTPLYAEIDDVVDGMQRHIDKMEPQIKEANDVIAFNAKVDRISGAITSVLNTAMDAYESVTSAATGDYGSLEGDVASAGGANSSAGSSSRKIDKKYNVNEKGNCDSDKRVYDNYEGQLMKMRTYPDKYDQRQKENIQQKMKSIRTKWENRGYSMRYSELEDWR